MNYLLDTNIVLTYIRDTDISRKLEEDLNLLSDINNLLISVVSVGELKSIAKQQNWGIRKVQKMLDVLQNFLIVDINTEEIIERYADIDAFSQGKLSGKKVKFTSRNMGKNDLWIAATASVYGLELITTDNDFVHLDKAYLGLKTVILSKYNFK